MTIKVKIHWDEKRADGSVRVYWGDKPAYWVSPDRAAKMEESAARRHDRYMAMMLPVRCDCCEE